MGAATPPDEPLDAAEEPPPPPPQAISMPLHKIEIRKLILFFEIGYFIFTPIQPWNSFAVQLPELLAGEHKLARRTVLLQQQLLIIVNY
jgi:hypothetical protein